MSTPSGKGRAGISMRLTVRRPRSRISGTGFARPVPDSESAPGAESDHEKRSRTHCRNGEIPAIRNLSRNDLGPPHSTGRRPSPVTTLTSLLAAHLDGSATIPQTIAACYARHRAHGDAAIFITLRPEAEVLAEAEALQAEGPRGRALWGVPVAVKDNIDVAGLPTTAACPAFAYEPERDATVVARLRAAGAIVIGKTNLDQFATGLVGVRSPYGACRNAIDPAFVSGGSSSGSAVAVALGLASFSLGTDTAGSGRVPASFNNLVGLKPTLGLLSGTGMVPACRSLDTVSIFALTAGDVQAVLGAAAAFDAADAYSRPAQPFGVDFSAG
eukprot:gene18358-25858_t